MELLRLCRDLDLASLNRAHLGMAILTGKSNLDSTFESDDVFSPAFEWFPGFSGPAVNPDWLDNLDSVRAVLNSDGRALAQGTFAWI